MTTILNAASSVNADIEPPVRYCTVCTKQIPPKRVAHGGRTCSDECRREDDRQRRAWRATKKCRLCGRPKRARKGKRIAPASQPVCRTGTSEHEGQEIESATSKAA